MRLRHFLFRSRIELSTLCFLTAPPSWAICFCLNETAPPNGHRLRCDHPAARMVLGRLPYLICYPWVCCLRRCCGSPWVVRNSYHGLFLFILLTWPLRLVCRCALEEEDQNVRLYDEEGRIIFNGGGVLTFIKLPLSSPHAFSTVLLRPRLWH